MHYAISAFLYISHHARLSLEVWVARKKRNQRSYMPRGSTTHPLCLCVQYKYYSSSPRIRSTDILVSEHRLHPPFQHVSPNQFTHPPDQDSRLPDSYSAVTPAMSSGCHVSRSSSLPPPRSYSPHYHSLVYESPTPALLSVIWHAQHLPGPSTGVTGVVPAKSEPCWKCTWTCEVG
jgi:hypothetical protein